MPSWSGFCLPGKLTREAAQRGGESLGFAASSLLLHSLAMCLDLGWVPPEDDLETEMRKHIIHLLGDGRKHQQGREGKEATPGCSKEQVTTGSN